MELEAAGLSHLWQDPVSGDLNRVLIMMHGRGDSIEGWESWLRSFGVPGLAALLLNAPDPYYTGYSWYALAPDQLPGVIRSRALVVKVLDELLARGFAPNQLILSGFSQGCLMTLEAGGRYPHRLGGYLGISGFCLDPVKLIAEASPAAKQGDWLITHGLHDDVLPIERTREQVRQLQAGGFNIDYREFNKAHNLAMPSEIKAIREWLRAR